MPAEWIWMAFVFAFGACVGSFLNVVIYRLPRDKSLVYPPSACPACGNHIRWYDNIPLFSWLNLRAKCRFCKSPISIRYFLVELLTASLFLGVYLWIFYFQRRQTGLEGDFAIQRFFEGGWLIYLNMMVLIAAFIAASAIDLELWIIPIGICLFVTAIGIVTAALGGFVIEPNQIELYNLLPTAGIKMAAVSFGAFIGLIFSLAALWTGLIKPSYPMEEGEDPNSTQVQYNDRKEILKEVVFLLPVIIGAAAGFFLLRNEAVMSFWQKAIQVHVIKGLMGALSGYLVGCTTIWATRIIGTLGFGREAMGLGDVHLMGAAGAVLGSGLVVVAFFVAPFFGLIWGIKQLIFKKSRQIPYGPFLSIAVFGVMIFHDWIQNLMMVWFMFKI